MNKFCALIALYLLTALPSIAQVNDIKSASRRNSSDRGSHGYSSATNVFFIIDMVRLGIVWQQNVLQKRNEIPGLVGFDLMVLGSVQPSAYYVLNPRIRGTWGIISSDFRVNYMIEESIGKNADLITYDWQVAQLNFINTRNVIVRAGTGFMQEGFGEHRSFTESTVSSNMIFNDKWRGFTEWRWAHDYNTGAAPRRELNLQVQRQLFDANHWHAFVTGGFQFQRYYSTVNIWGIQFGLAFKFY